MEQKSLTAAMLNKYLYETEDAEELLEELLKIAERIFEDTRYSISKLLSAASKELKCTPVKGLKYRRDNLRSKLESAMRAAVSDRRSLRSNRRNVPVYTGKIRPPFSVFDKKGYWKKSKGE